VSNNAEPGKGFNKGPRHDDRLQDEDEVEDGGWVRGWG